MEKNPGMETEAAGQTLQENALERLRKLIVRRQEGQKRRRLHVIINPAAGRDEPILKTMNTAMQEADIDWDVFLTKQAGDAHRLAQEAVRAGVDAVAVYGGDGTVMEVASGLMGSGIPLAIIPGGTANVMAAEVGIPGDLISSCALAVHPSPHVREVDMGRIGDRYFLLRVGMGLEAAMVEGADRELKDRLGVFAYGLSALQALSNPPAAHYRLRLDGEEVEAEGLTCIIANSGAVGLRSISLAPNISVSDGLLDVIILRNADVGALLSVAASMASGNENRENLLRWQARHIEVEADPPQTVQADGEILGTTPITVEVVPAAVHMIAPEPQQNP